MPCTKIGINKHHCNIPLLSGLHYKSVSNSYTCVWETILFAHSPLKHKQIRCLQVLYSPQLSAVVFDVRFSNLGVVFMDMDGSPYSASQMCTLTLTFLRASACGHHTLPGYPRVTNACIAQRWNSCHCRRNGPLHDQLAVQVVIEGQ